MMSRTPSSLFILCSKCTQAANLSSSSRCLSAFYSYGSKNDSETRSVIPIHHNNRSVKKLPGWHSQREYRPSWFGGESGVSKAVSQAEKIVGYPTSFLSLRCLLSDELSNVALHMRKLVGTKHPLLKTARGLVFDGKHNLQLRGLIVMLISKAAGPSAVIENTEHEEMISGVYPSQRSLAEIIEVIHTANLIHKGVVNLDSLSPDPEEMLSNMEFGNKMSVLSGDFLLASACTGLAKLGNPSVVEEVASSIGDMMTAEFTQYTDACGNPQVPENCKGFSDWLRQTYLSFGSLLAKSCQSAMMLAGHSKELQSKAYLFGENMTYAQQLCSDIAPFVKPDELSSMSLTSAPILLYSEQVSKAEFEHLKQLWEDGPVNYKTIVDIVSATGVIKQCKELCHQYRDKAIAALDCYTDSEAKDALVNMVTVVSDIR